MELNLLQKLQPAPLDGGFKMNNYWIWCGSVIKGEDGRYHMFASRWSKLYSMHPGWIFKSEIVRAVSVKPEGPYEFQEVVLKERGAQYWDGMATHNPSITKYKDTYILFYTGTTYPVGNLSSSETTMEDDKYIVAQSNKRIGIATSTSVFGPWQRKNQPILPVRSEKFDNFLTSNAAPCVMEDGSVILVYKSRDYKDNKMGKMVLSSAYAKHYEGPYDTRLDEPLFCDEKDYSVHGLFEDPFIWKDYYGFHMIAKDMTGVISGEKYAGIFAFSSNGMNWEIEKGVKAYSRNILWSDGQTRQMGRFERPFILFEDKKPIAIFAATADDDIEGLGNAGTTWNMAIPIRT